MEHARYPHKIVLLTTGFQYTDRYLFFPRARLFYDRIELSGWHLNTRIHEQLLLHDVEDITWQDDPSSRPNVVFHMADGRDVALRLHQYRAWQRKLDARFRWTPLARTHRPGLGRVLDLPLKDLVAYTSGMS